MKKMEYSLLILFVLIFCSCSKSSNRNITKSKIEKTEVPEIISTGNEIDNHIEKIFENKDFSIELLGSEELYMVNKNGGKILLINETKININIISIVDIRVSPSATWLLVILDVKDENDSIETIDVIINLRDNFIVSNLTIKKYSQSHFYDFKIKENKEYIEALNIDGDDIILVDLILYI